VGRDYRGHNGGLAIECDAMLRPAWDGALSGPGLSMERDEE
jgi:hypothetical protein